MSGEHEILPQCQERFVNITERDKRMEAKLDKICKAVVGPNGQSLSGRIATLEGFRKGARWMLAILVALLGLAGAAYAAMHTIGSVIR